MTRIRLIEWLVVAVLVIAFHGVALTGWAVFAPPLPPPSQNPAPVTAASSERPAVAPLPIIVTIDGEQPAPTVAAAPADAPSDAPVEPEPRVLAQVPETPEVAEGGRLASDMTRLQLPQQQPGGPAAPTAPAQPVVVQPQPAEPITVQPQPAEPPAAPSPPTATARAAPDDSGGESAPPPAAAEVTEADRLLEQIDRDMAREAAASGTTSQPDPMLAEIERDLERDIGGRTSAPQQQAAIAPARPGGAAPTPAPTAPAESSEPATAPRPSGALRDPVPTPRLKPAPPPPAAPTDTAGEPGSPQDTARSGAASQQTESQVAAVEPRQPAQTTPAAAAAQSTYYRRLLARISRATVYPAEAREARLSGTVYLQIVVERSGRIRSYDILTSSGHEVLDKAAVQALSRANPGPAFPDDITEQQLRFGVPVRFAAPAG